eukprot:3666447-Amphidinium_carterae.1
MRSRERFPTEDLPTPTPPQSQGLKKPPKVRLFFCTFGTILFETLGIEVGIGEGWGQILGFQTLAGTKSTCNRPSVQDDFGSNLDAIRTYTTMHYGSY